MVADGAVGRPSSASPGVYLLLPTPQGGPFDIPVGAASESEHVVGAGLASGYRAFADYEAASGLNVIVASNLTSGALDKIRDALPKIVAGEEVPTPAPIKATAADVDPAVLESYQGAYELRPGRNLELRVIGGRAQMNDWLLIPTSETTLFSPQDYAEIEVVIGDDEEVARLDWTTGGQTYPLPRVSAGSVE